MKFGTCVQEGVKSGSKSGQGAAFVCVETRVCLIGSNPSA